MGHLSQQKKKSIVIVSWILVFLWMGFIFYMSAQDSGASSGFSRPIAETTAKYFVKFHVVSESKIADFSYITQLESTIRKIAHSTVFFVLSVLVSLSLLASGIKGVRVLIISIMLSVLYAFADEFHQFFVPGRATEMADIFLDVLGTVLGTVLVLVISGLLGMRKSATKKAPLQTAKKAPLQTAKKERPAEPFRANEKVLEFKKRQLQETKAQKTTSVLKPAVKKQNIVTKEIVIAVWFKIGIAVSFSVLCAIISSNVKYMPISALNAFAFAIFVIFKLKVLDNNIKKMSVARIVLSTILAVFTIISVYASFRLAANAYIAELGIVIDDFYYNFIRSGLSAFAVPSIIVLWYIVLGKAKVLAAKIRFTKFEISYIAVFTFAISIVLLYVYNRTSAFYNPLDHNNIIFSLDTRTVIAEFSHTNFNSSINTVFQPIFSLAAMPFGVLSRILSYPLAILPGFNMPGAEALALSTVNAVLLGVTAVIFSRVFIVRNKALFLAVFTVSFPSLFSILVPSGGITVAFYVALFIFIMIKTDLSYTAPLTLMSSAFLPFAVLPLAVGKRKRNAKSTVKAYLYIAALIILCGNIFGYLDIVHTIKHIPRLKEVIPAALRMSFMSLFSPSGSVSSGPNYTLDYVTNTLSYALGAAVAVAAVLGTWVNKHNAAARISALAIAISWIFSLYFVATLTHSGIILFLVCFSWAYIGLLYNLAEKVFNPDKLLFKTLMAMTIIILLFYNYKGIRDIVVYCFNYYSG